MIVSDAVKIMEDFEPWIPWWRTQHRMMRTSEIIQELKKVDQNLTVLQFEESRTRVIPELYILVDGVKK